MKSISKNTWIAILFWLLPILGYWVIFRLIYQPTLFLWISNVWYPVWAIIVCYFIGDRNRFGIWKWIFPVLFTFMYLCVHYLTHGVTNILWKTQFVGGFEAVSENISMLMIYTGGSYVSMLIGGVIGRKIKRE